MSDTPETDAAMSVGLENADRECVPADFARKLERERDEAREALKHISEYGTEEINAAVDLRQKLASALIERDEALIELEEYRSIAETIGAKKAVSEKENAIRERDEAREEREALEERDKEWFQVIESFAGFHPVSITDALKQGIKWKKSLKSECDEARELVHNLYSAACELRRFTAAYANDYDEVDGKEGALNAISDFYDASKNIAKILGEETAK